MNFADLIETPSSIYSMHKYWGKKPSKELKAIIKKYSKEYDKILDPFSGFGGIGLEAILLNRNVILNDLNPSATFIANNVLNYNIDVSYFIELFNKIKSLYSVYLKDWYDYKGELIISILRNRDGTPIKLKLYDNQKKVYRDLELENNEQLEFLEKENNYRINVWYPANYLIPNSRIGIKEDVCLSDLFPKRALICHSLLFNLIQSLPDSPERELLLFAFTANVANCSKLVPPIKTRGEMSPGAWMTGFYIAEQYLENNVFHYFENRVDKIIKGKTDLINLINYKEKIGEYTITNSDAKHIAVNDESVDLVFTDFPYGDSVPYFEQSQIWNSWLSFNVDYDNEIVISDSKKRKKTNENFERDIEISIAEISRVLKCNSYFVFTFHSMYGDVWSSIVNALAKTDLQFVESSLLVQKTLPPRQLNRKKTIKGDMLVVFQKKGNIDIKSLNNTSFNLETYLRSVCKENVLYDTNELIVLCVNKMLEQKASTEKCDFIKIINTCFEESNGKWRMKNAV